MEAETIVLRTEALQKSFGSLQVTRNISLDNIARLADALGTPAPVLLTKAGG